MGTGIMKAAQIRSYGGNEVVEIAANALRPTVSEGKVVVEVYAAGVNPIDWKVRQGYLAQRLPLQFPVTLGGDFSGVIAEVGSGVDSLRVGEEVYGQAGVLHEGSGSFAEYVLVSGRNVAAKPRNIHHRDAAALPLVGTSALQALLKHMDLRKGQKILIHGAAGGIGTIAVQIARDIGAYIFATAGAEDAAYVKGLGADQVIDYRTQKFEDVAQGLDAVFDPVGGETYSRSFAALKKGGVIVSMLEQPDKELMEKYGVKAVSQFTQPDAASLETLAGLVEKGAVKVFVDKTFPLDATGEALHYLETGHPKGKVVLEIRGDS